MSQIVTIKFQRGVREWTERMDDEVFAAVYLNAVPGDIDRVELDGRPDSGIDAIVTFREDEPLAVPDVGEVLGGPREMRRYFHKKAAPWH